MTGDPERGKEFPKMCLRRIQVEGSPLKIQGERGALGTGSRLFRQLRLLPNASELYQELLEFRVALERLKQRIPGEPAEAGEPGVGRLGEPAVRLLRLSQLGIRRADAVGHVMIHIAA